MKVGIFVRFIGLIFGILSLFLSFKLHHTFFLTRPRRKKKEERSVDTFLLLVVAFSFSLSLSFFLSSLIKIFISCDALLLLLFIFLYSFSRSLLSFSSFSLFSSFFAPHGHSPSPPPRVGTRSQSRVCVHRIKPIRSTSRQW